MRSSAFTVVLLLLGTAALIPAEQSSQSFEVISIKVRTTGGGAAVPASPDRFIATNNSLRDLAEYAYGLQRFQVVGGPDWIDSARFDVDAKATFVPSPDQMRLMVQDLLVDRFHLKASKTARDLPVYTLRVAREGGELGPQITRTTVDCDAVEKERMRLGQVAPRTASQPDERPVCTTWLVARPTPNGVTVRYRTSGTTSLEFATFLSSYAGRTVTDDTGLRGEFDIDLSFDPSSRPSVSADPPDSHPTIFAAVQEQLGLKLESARGPVEVLIIESAERPTPN